MVGSQHALLEPAPTGDVAACSQSARAGARDGALVCKPMYAKNRSITADPSIGRNPLEVAAAVQAARQIPTKREEAAGRRRRFMVDMESFS